MLGIHCDSATGRDYRNHPFFLCPQKWKKESPTIPPSVALQTREAKHELKSTETQGGIKSL